MSILDQIVADAVARKDLPYAVGMVADRSAVLWQGGAGPATAAGTGGPDTVFRIMSMTKAIGCVAALILVDRGLLTLDTPVESVLPEFRDIRVLESIGPDGPVLRQPRRQCLLRHLLTHTSGFAYNTFSANQAAYQRLPGAPDILAGTLAGFSYPLMFDPGEDFIYGIGIDWGGRMIERVDGRGIDQFCREEILDPLGMHDTTFELEGDRSRLAQLKTRGADGGFVDLVYEIPSHPEEYGMGHALYSTAADYVRFLRMVLNNGELDGHRLISPAIFDLLRTNQLGALSVPVMKTVLPEMSADVDLFPGTRLTWTAGFLRNEADIPGRRAAGSLTWAGFLNTHYWIDPTNGIAAVLMTQLLPFCDPGYLNAYVAFERAVYEVFTGRAQHRPAARDTAVAG